MQLIHAHTFRYDELLLEAEYAVERCIDWLIYMLQTQEVVNFGTTCEINTHIQFTPYNIVHIVSISQQIGN